VLVSPGSWPLSFEGDLIAAAGDSSQDLTVLHDLRLLVVFRGRSLRASRVYCAYFPLRGTQWGTPWGTRLCAGAFAMPVVGQG